MPCDSSRAQSRSTRSDEIWTELVREITRSGIGQISTFVTDPVHFLYSEVNDAAAWDRLWNSDIHLRWSESTQHVMDIGDDGIVESTTLREVFHFQS